MKHLLQQLINGEHLSEEQSREANVLDFVEGDGCDAALVEQQDLGVGAGHQDRRVGGDDELAILGYRVLD